MIKEKINELITESLSQVLKDPDKQKELTESIDINLVLEALLKTKEFQGLLIAIRGLTNSVSEINENMKHMVHTVETHQIIIEDLILSQKALVQQKVKPPIDISLKFEDKDKKPSKPN